jgi:hypothetical protein
VAVENMSHGPRRLTSIALAPTFGETPCMEETELLWKDMRKLYDNARMHLLAGNSA